MTPREAWAAGCVAMRDSIVANLLLAANELSTLSPATVARAVAVMPFPTELSGEDDFVTQEAAKLSMSAEDFRGEYQIFRTVAVPETFSASRWPLDVIGDYYRGKAARLADRVATLEAAVKPEGKGVGDVRGQVAP